MTCVTLAWNTAATYHELQPTAPQLHMHWRFGMDEYGRRRLLSGWYSEQQCHVLFIEP